MEGTIQHTNRDSIEGEVLMNPPATPPNKDTCVTMNKNTCSFCGELIPDQCGVYLDGKLYCNQRHAEKGFIGMSYYEMME